MKTTVSFDQINIVVPCGDGNLTIAELSQFAIDKFKKLTAKPREHNVIINSIRLKRDNGMLDWDDLVCDVLDDRELLIAEYSEQPAVQYVSNHHNGDGASAGSSIGTASPEIVQVISGSMMNPNPINPTDVIVTHDDIARRSNMSTLIVRQPPETTVLDNRRRLNNSPQSQPIRQSDYQTLEVKEPPQEKLPVVPNRSSYSRRPDLSRGPGRRSLGNSTDLQKWLDSQQQLEDEAYSRDRMDPIGASVGSQEDDLDASISRLHFHIKLDIKPNQGHGITLRPWVDMKTRENRGIDIRNIDREGTFAANGQLRAGDLIISINDTALSGVSFNRCLDTFNAALQNQEFDLGILRPPSSRLKCHDEPPPPLPKRPYRTAPSSPVNSFRSAFHPIAPDLKKSLETDFSSKPVPPPRSSSTKLSATTPIQDINNLNVRKLGRQYTIDFIRSPTAGFGFTLTSRDNPTGGPNPIYVKKIIHGGPAYQDGRLKVGDRILRVNEEDVTGSGCSHHSIAEMLRSQPVGSTVTLVISRQEVSDEKSGDLCEEQLTFDIPLYRYSGGLGINVRCHSFDDGQESGIFVDSIIPDRAAHFDGQLRPQDRLVRINDHVLVGLDKQVATEMLKKSIEESLQSNLRLTVARVVDRCQEINTVDNDHCNDLDHQPMASTSTITSSSQHVILHPTAVKPFPTVSTTHNDSNVELMPRLRMKEVKEGRMSASTSNLLDYECSSDEDAPKKWSFSRESKGRQSMSEKHKAYNDPKSSQFYQEQFLPKRQEKEDVDRAYSTLPANSRIKNGRQLNTEQSGSESHLNSQHSVNRNCPPTSTGGGSRTDYNRAAQNPQSSIAKRPQYFNSPPPAYNGGTANSPAYPMRPADSVDNLIGSPKCRSPLVRSPSSHEDPHHSSSVMSSGIKRGGVANTSFRRAVDPSYQSNHQQSASVPAPGTAPDYSVSIHHSQDLVKNAKKKDKSHSNWKDVFKINPKSSRKFSLENRSTPGDANSKFLRSDMEAGTVGLYSSTSAGRVLEWQQQNEAVLQRDRLYQQQQHQLLDSHRSHQAAVSSNRSAVPSVGDMERIKQTQHLRDRLHPVEPQNEVSQLSYRDSSSHSVNSSYRRASSVPPFHSVEDPYTMVEETPPPAPPIPHIYSTRHSATSSRHNNPSSHSSRTGGGAAPPPLQSSTNQQPNVSRHYQQSAPQPPPMKFSHSGGPPVLSYHQQPFHNVSKSSNNNAPGHSSVELLPNRRQIRPPHTTTNTTSSTVPHYSVGENEEIYAFVNKPHKKPLNSSMLS